MKHVADKIEYSEDITHNQTVSKDDPTDTVTRFINDGPTKHSEAVLPSREDDRTKQDTDWSELTIKDFLKIPIAIHNSVTDGTSTGRLAIIRFPDQLLQNEALKAKLQGYMGIKATTVIRLAVNADKFTQGRFILSWYPDNGFNTQHNWDVYEDHQRLTQLPNVQLDVNTETEAVLRIPYRGPSSHFNLSGGVIGRFGWCMLHPLLPIRGGQVNFTLYAHLEDIELTSPTFPTGIVAQSGLDLTGVEDTKKVEVVETKSTGQVPRSGRPLPKYDIPVLASPFSYVSADPGIRYQSGLAVEENNQKLSERIRGLGSVATSLSRVPILSSVMMPLGWLSEVTAGVASSLGYSKPLNTKSPETIVHRTVPRITQYDGVDWAESLGCSSQARVGIDQQLGLTSQDEMSFKFLTQIRSSVAKGNWGLDKGFGSRLAKIPLSPYHMSGPSSYYAPNACAVGHPIFFLSQAFGLYRGSFELTFVFSKTAFHSGRLLVAFEPVPGAATSKVETVSDCHYCHKDIIDVRSGHTFSITVPYTSTVPYRECYQPYGYVHVFVQNPLVLNQNNVQSSVDWVLMVNGKDDWEFAGPREPRLWPFRPSLSAPAALPRNANTVVESPIVPQSGLDEDHVEIVSKPIGKSTYAGESHSPSALCIGEKICSVKQLCMRSKLVSIGTHDMSPDPFGVDHVYSKAPIFDGATYVGYRDWHSFFGSLYAYNRGGVVLTYHNRGYKPMVVGLAIRDKLGMSPATGISDKGDLLQSAYINTGEAVRLYVPPYNRGYCRVSYDSVRVTLGDPGHNDPGVGLVRVYTQSVGSSLGEDDVIANIWRCSAEDTQFGYFIGVPLLTPCNLQTEGTFPTFSLYNTDGFGT